MNPRTCNYFVTLRCNDTCEFSTLWQNEDHKKIDEKGFDLSLLKRAGVERLNVTGGEPLLREDLPQVLRQAKELGLPVKLTSNGILYPGKADLLKGLTDELCFSLDHPVAEEHDRSRGVECFHLVIQSIKLAQRLGERPIVSFSMTRDSVRFLPEMVELAGRLQVRLCLEPVCDFFGTQGFEGATAAYIRYYFKRKKVQLNLAVLEFAREGGNRTVLPRCRARETTVTVLPDGSNVSPCFFNQGGRQGREDICSSCMRWPYMVPSFSKGFDKYFWLDLYSRFNTWSKGALK